MINLSEEEYKSGRYRTQFEEFGIVPDFAEAEMCGCNVIAQQEDGSCYYLKDGKCSIHADRPEVCRKFFCSTDDPSYAGMREKIRKYKME